MQCSLYCGNDFTESKNLLPSLKPPIDKFIRSGVVYRISCPRCNACYVGCTCRHMITRFKEHIQPSKPVAKHLRECRTSVKVNDVEILASSARGEEFLLTLEALWIKQVGPALNTKDEYKSRILTIRL